MRVRTDENMVTDPFHHMYVLRRRLRNRSTPYNMYTQTMRIRSALFFFSSLFFILVLVGRVMFNNRNGI